MSEIAKIAIGLVFFFLVCAVLYFLSPNKRQNRTRSSSRNTQSQSEHIAETEHGNNNSATGSEGSNDRWYKHKYVKILFWILVVALVAWGIYFLIEWFGGVKQDVKTAPKDTFVWSEYWDTLVPYWHEYKIWICSVVLIGIFWQWLFKNLLKVGIKIVIAGVVAFCIWGLLGDWTVNSVDKFHRIMESKKQLYPKPVPVVQERTVYWSHRNTDGTIPVGVWSEAVTGLPVGCTIDIPDTEIDTIYHIQYRTGGKWYDKIPYIANSYSALKVQMIVPGVREKTFKFECQK